MTTSQLINTLWVLIAAFMVFFMNAGFALVESGLCRSKNTVNILTKNFIVFGFAVVGFWTLGYGLMFGDGSAFVGLDGFLLQGLPLYTGDAGDGLPRLAHFFFQLCFAVTAATIVSGAVAERIKISSFIIFSIVLTSVVYPIVGHWAWGGGFLSERGFSDFAGSTVVHSVGGWAALVGAWMLGPRVGKYINPGSNRRVAKPIPGHNMALVTLGGLFLWFGWFGFNGGSELAVNAAVAHISATTALAASFGTVAATLWVWLRMGKPDVTFIINGMLGGLVGVTAGCNVVPLWAAAIIGAVAGVLVIESVLFMERRGIDDPVGAISVHLVCGVFGTLMVGFFSSANLPHMEPGGQSAGLLLGGGPALLLEQCIGIACVGAFVGGASLFFWFVIKQTIGIRVSKQEERTGLDISEHGMEAYPAPVELVG